MSETHVTWKELEVGNHSIGVLVYDPDSYGDKNGASECL